MSGVSFGTIDDIDERNIHVGMSYARRCPRATVLQHVGVSFLYTSGLESEVRKTRYEQSRGHPRSKSLYIYDIYIYISAGENLEQGASSDVNSIQWANHGKSRKSLLREAQ